MNQSSLSMVGAVVFLTFATASAFAGSHKFINFDVPGKKDTIPLSINDNNDVVGTYMEDVHERGFIRMSDGTFQTINVSDAYSTIPLAVNISDEVVGYFYDSKFTSHGFVRMPDATIITIDIPHSKSTFPDALNDNGDIVGSFEDRDGGHHGFLRKASGEITLFDPTDSISTTPTGINNGGVIVGFYCSTDCFSADTGFVRSAEGAIKTFSVEGATRTEPASINSRDEIAGRYVGGLAQGFVRSPNGKILVFSECAYVPGLNETGWTAGASVDNGISQGCLRAPNGTVSLLNDPKAHGNGTSLSDINARRYITGWYSDSHDHNHGFIVRPSK